MGKKAKEKDAGSATSRRSFFATIWLGLVVVAMAEFVWLVISFLRPRRPKAEESGSDSLIETGSVDSFELGTVTAFTRGRFYLVRLEDGGFLALSCECTHLGCTVPWVSEEGRFVCPCHSSTFDIAGNVISAPAPRGLDFFKVSIENNIVKVDTSKAIRRAEFREKQIVYPEKI